MVSPIDTSITIARCDPAKDKSVLALAALVWPEAVRADHWREVAASLHDRGHDSIALLAAWRGDQLIAAALGQTLPGKAAVVWPPQLLVPDEPNRRGLAGQLLVPLLAELKSNGAQLAQSLLATDDHVAGELLQAGGFAPAAELLYLAAGEHEFPTQPLVLPFELVPFTALPPSRLASLIERTYVGTLDCPQIDGLRTTADVIAGYQGVGVFRPQLWQIARLADEDIACLLVNVHPDVRHAEIVYLGVVPEARGRGLGLELARHAQWLARQAGCEQTVLAVDAANEPAISVYAAAGFREFDRKTVWIKSLR